MPVRIFLLALLLTSCSKLPIRDERPADSLGFFEKELDSQDNINRQFHVAAAANLEVTGYIIGVEKAKKDAIGFSSANLPSYRGKVDKEGLLKNCNNSKYLLFDDVKYKDVEGIGVIRPLLAKKLKSYKKITFVSHVNKYSYITPDDPKTNVISEYVYSAPYSCSASRAPYCKYLSFRDRKESCEVLGENAYNAGWQALLDLKKNLNKDLADAKKRGKPYSHIIIYSMGWNTTQRESIQNFNFLEGNLIRLAQENQQLRNFNPLMIGITWPSDWAMEQGDGGLADSVIYPVRKLLSFFTKEDDADEVGDIWGNILLHKTLLPIKKQHPDLKLVMIGHSFGTRVITNSIFADPMDSEAKKERHEKVDLVIGFQGALPIERFIQGWNSKHYSYRDFDKKVKKIIFTWSPYDEAVGIIKGYVGSKTAHNRISEKHPEIFEQAQVDSCGNFVKSGLFVKNNFEPECFANPQDQQILTQDAKKLIYVDAAKLINHRPQGAAGGAHSDIFHDGVTQMIINSLGMVQK